MASLLAQIESEQGNRYWGPVLPLRLLEELGRNALGPHQRSKPGVVPSRGGVPTRAVMPDFVALPPGVSDKSNQVETLLTQAAQADLGVPEVVAILDTGMKQSHPLLRRLILESIDLVQEDGDTRASDLHGHGTMVALLIALSTPHVQFINIKVVNKNAHTTRELVARGIKEAMAYAPSRISLSLGFEDTCSFFNRCDVCRAAASAIDAGSFLFAAPGNTRGARACPSRQEGVFTVASHDLRSTLADASSLTPESQARLYNGRTDKEEVAEEALRNARYFLSLFNKRYVDNATDDQAYDHLKSALILAKEAFRLAPAREAEVADVLDTIIRSAERFPLDLAPWLVEDLWYHMPDKLNATRGFVRQTDLHGTSFSLANGMAVPASFAGAVEVIAGWYQLTPHAVMSKTAYSGKGDFLGAVGRYMMVSYEHALLARARYLEAQRRLGDAIDRFVIDAPSEPDDFLELGLLRLINGDVEKAVGLLREATKSRLDWAFPNNVLSQLGAA